MVSFIVLIILEFIWSCPVELDGLIFLIICIVSLFVMYGSLKLLICLGIKLFSIVIGSPLQLLMFCLVQFILLMYKLLASSAIFNGLFIVSLLCVIKFGLVICLVFVSVYQVFHWSFDFMNFLFKSAVFCFLISFDIFFL